MPLDSDAAGSGVGALVYCGGGGARTRLLAAVALEAGLVSITGAGAGAGDVGESDAADGGCDAMFDTDRLAVAAYPELSEFIVSLRPKDGATDEFEDSKSTGGGMALACS